MYFVKSTFSLTIKCVNSHVFYHNQSNEEYTEASKQGFFMAFSLLSCILVFLFVI